MALAFALKARHNFSEAESDMLQLGAGLRAEEIFSALQDGVLPRVFDVLQTTLQHTLRPNAPHTAAGGPLIPDDPSLPTGCTRRCRWEQAAAHFQAKSIRKLGNSTVVCVGVGAPLSR